MSSRKVKLSSFMVFVSFVLFLVAFAGPAHAQVPQLMNYQARLTDSSGVPLNSPPNYEITFSVYDVATGGTALWTETQTVVITNGLLSTLLGSVTSLPTNLFVGGERYLGVKVGTDAEMAPRSRIVSVAYSLNADKLDGQDSTDFADAAHGHLGESWSGSDTTALSVATTSSTDQSKAMYGHASSSTSNTTFGGYFQTESTAGRGVFGNATASSGYTYGVFGQSASTVGSGVLGQATAATGASRGVQGLTSSSQGTAVYGYANAASGETYGVEGAIESPAGAGVRGWANSSSGATYGGYFRSISTTGAGVYAYGSASTGATYGVYGKVESAAGFAGYFTGGRGIYVSKTIESAAATGTPPLAVVSTTKVDNLNADLLDGNESTAFAAAAHNHAAASITSGKIDNARLNTGTGNGLDADAVDGVHAAATPGPGKLFPLDANGYLPDSVFPAHTLGDKLLAAADRQFFGTEAEGFTKLKEIVIPRAGTLRITFDIKSNADGGAKAQIYRNDSPVGTLRYPPTRDVWETYSEDIGGWSSQDKCQLYGGYNGGGDAWIRRFRIYATNAVAPVVTLDTGN